ncbi:MAG: hypothetical protein HC866_11020 [Leptolyngbyaceae cyanobacterium RU_5_1]|nr:hypothetical protein [Leptolyngbyaceae cyanobacterium RU_5_1]
MITEKTSSSILTTALEQVKPSTQQPDQPDPQTELEDPAILPRSAWSSQLARLRIILKAKQSLDRQEMNQQDHVLTSQTIPFQTSQDLRKPQRFNQHQAS